MSVREQGDRAFMAGFIRVMMDQLVQRLAGGHRSDKQNQSDQQDGNERLAEPTEMYLLVSQTICNLVEAGADANFICSFGWKLCGYGIHVEF